nr:NADH dehydrogenase subunit 4 [Hydroides norvegica]
MFSLGVAVGVLSVISKGAFFSVYSVAFFILFVWVSLRGFSGSYDGQILVENYISHGFLLLSLWLGVLVFLMEYQGPLKHQFCNFVFLVCGFCSLSFMAGNGMVYFMLFEAVFVPISALVLIWGYNKERVSAVIYMVVYSFLGGGFHLVSLLGLFESTGSLFLGVGLVGKGFSVEVFLWWLGLVVLFLVKAPLFMFHLWLPKAHVEAPTCASMLLAGLLLKLGSYGLFLYDGVWQCSGLWGSIWQILGLWGAVHAGLLCLRELNLKKIVALSSVSHMSLSISSFFVGTQGGWDSMYLMGVMHGLCSSGMFSWVGCQYYHSSNQNSLLVSGYRSVGGLAGVSLVILLLGMAGMPPMGSFWGEFFIYSVFLNSFLSGGVVLILAGFVNLLFVCYLGLWVCHGEWGMSSSKVFWGGDRSYLCLLGHWAPCILLFFFVFLIFI